MVSRGAEATDAEVEKIVDYLVKNMGPKVNVNKATAQDLMAKLGLSEAASAAIVGYREKNGSFKTLDELKKVEGVDPTEIESRKGRIEF
jgi:competence protein ComEA